MTVLSGPIRRAGVVVSLALLFLAPRIAAADSPVQQFGGVLHDFNPSLSATAARDMAAHVLWMASYYGLDPRLLVAIVGVESGWQSQAVSRAGAQGLGQLMPATAGGLDVRAFDAYENLDGTARYLRRMIAQYPGSDTERRYALALASYNAGPAAVARAGGIPPYAETRTCVERVLRLWHHLQTVLPAAGAQAVAFVTASHAPATVHRAPARRPAPRTAGSVAAFMALDARSLQEYDYYVALNSPPTPTPAPQRHSVGHWLQRALGYAKR